MRFLNNAFSTQRLPFRCWTHRACALAMLMTLATAPTSTALHSEQRTAPSIQSIEPSHEAAIPILKASQSLVVEDRQGYDSEYIFGMTRGVSHSTLLPALKPLAFIVTVPLDLVLLPFAAIGGFF